MRCLYCGIRLKIAEKGQMIKLCPECSMRAEYESRRKARAAQDAGAAALPADDVGRRTLFASMKSA